MPVRTTFAPPSSKAGPPPRVNQQNVKVWRPSGEANPMPKPVPFTETSESRAAYPEHPATNGPARRPPPGEQPPQRAAPTPLSTAQASYGKLPLAEVMAEVAPIAKVVRRSTSLLAGGGEVDPAYDDAAPRQWTVEHIDEPTGNSESRAAYPAHPATRGPAKAPPPGAPPPQRADPTPMSTAQASYGRLPLAEAKRDADPSPWGHQTISLYGDRRPITSESRAAYAPPRGRAATELAVAKAAAGGTAVALGLLVATPTRSEFLEFLPAGVAPPATADGVITGVADGQERLDLRVVAKGGQDGLELRLLGSLALAVAPSAAGKQQVHVSFALRADGTLALAAAEVQPNVARATFSTSGVALPGGRLLGEATITDAAAPF